MKLFKSFNIDSFFTKKKIDNDLLEKFEELLVESDVGLKAAKTLKENFKKEKIGKEIKNKFEIYKFLGNQITKLLIPYEKKIETLSKNSPSIIIVAGVNGVGKTSTVGKIGYLFKKNKKVVFGAADTFRAAAIDQLEIWSKKVGADIIKSEIGSDPASVCFKTVKFAEENNADLVLIDTAGRLQNKKNLMDEYKKILKVLKKINPAYPHETILVLDATTGQNALNQVEEFNKISNITALIFTKLDTTAKGGVIVSIAQKFQIPIVAVGLGEKDKDLYQFKADEYVKMLIKE